VGKVYLEQTSGVKNPIASKIPVDTKYIIGYSVPQDVGVFKFNLGDIEKFRGSPVPFVGGAYLDNENNLAWMLHLTPIRH
jgi:hypothetical protein